MRFVRILIAPAAVFGSSFSMALQFALLTPFSVALGVSRTMASMVWLVGPTTGLIIQPAVGCLSDMYHRMHATRLPIVCVSAAVLMVSHIGIAYCLWLSWAISVSPIAVLVVCFWVFDSANNAIIVTMRAMLADRFGKEHRTFAFSVLQFWTSLGSIVGYLVAQHDWATPGSGTDHEASSSVAALETNIHYCFLISGIMVGIGTTLSVVSVYEKRACRMRFHGIHTGEGFKMNKVFLEPCLMAIVVGSMLTWFGWFSQQIYQSDFVAGEILGSSASPAAAVQLSAFGLLISSALSCIAGLLLPVLLAQIGNESATLFRVWSLACVCQGVVLLCSPFVETVAGVIVWESAVGPMMAIALTVPFMLVASGCDHGSSGRIMALVNVAVCLPQLVVALVGGMLTKVAQTDVVLFVIGGVLCLAAAWLLWVPGGTELPPWSQASTASLIASKSDLYSSIRDNIFIDEMIDSEFRLRGLSSPRLNEPLLNGLLT